MVELRLNTTSLTARHGEAEAPNRMALAEGARERISRRKIKGAVR